MIFSRGSTLCSKRSNIDSYVGRHAGLFAPSSTFSKILVANRGEIACRVIRTAKHMGVGTVAVYSDADATSLHVALADEAIRIGPAPAVESYLRGDVIIDAARRSGAESLRSLLHWFMRNGKLPITVSANVIADRGAPRSKTVALSEPIADTYLAKALHPGYGFLSENASFAKACSSAGITFVGPPPQAIDAMGSKSVAKSMMIDAGVPVCPGYHGEEQGDDAFLENEAERIGYPLMIKAVMGGGGKGMRLVESAETFQAALEACRREALTGFADSRMLLERYVREPRHIEVQVFADTLGNAVHLFERDCSVQRRHQKVLEEAPAPGLSEETRAELGQAAVRAARAVDYVGAGTVEFLMDTSTQEFFFCEMNTRLQVEHPVTEMITGLDLVEWQLRVAAGQPLPITNQADIKLAGHAIEARICAENVHRGFLPATGTLQRMRFPEEAVAGGGGGGGAAGDDGIYPGDQTGVVRVDTGVREGDTVSMHYDPMLAKVIVHASTRADALSCLRKVLKHFQVVGLPTNVEFCERVAGHMAFARGGVTTAFLEEHRNEVMPSPDSIPPPAHALVLASLAVLLEERAAYIRPDDYSPWSARSGPWRAVGVHRQRLVFHPPDGVVSGSEGRGWVRPGQATAESEAEIRERTGEDGRATNRRAGSFDLSVECLPENGEYVVELHGARHTVSGAEMDGSGKLSAIVDDRRYTVDAVVDGWGEVGARGCVTLWSGHGVIEGDAHKRHRFGLSVTRPRGREARLPSDSASLSAKTAVVSPMPGKIIRVLASSGDHVVKGQEIVILEAMKMEHTVSAPCTGVVVLATFAEGDLVDEGATLVTIGPLDAGADTRAAVVPTTH